MEGKLNKKIGAQNLNTTIDLIIEKEKLKTAKSKLQYSKTDEDVKTKQDLTIQILKLENQIKEQQKKEKELQKEKEEKRLQKEEKEKRLQKERDKIVKYELDNERIQKRELALGSFFLQFNQRFQVYSIMIEQNPTYLIYDVKFKTHYIKSEKGLNSFLYLEMINTFSNKEFISNTCLLYTSPSPRDGLLSRMPSSA